MYNESTKKSTMKYMKEKRDKLTLNFPSGYKDLYKEYAEFKGQSLTSLIMELIKLDMDNSDFEEYYKSKKESEERK